MCKLSIVSDVHSELNDQLPVIPSDQSDADALVLAGDIGYVFDGSLKRYFSRCRSEWGAKPILFVPGNHDYWHMHGSIEERDFILKSICDEYGIHFMQRKVVQIAGKRIAGCTLWTNRSSISVPVLNQLKDYKSDYGNLIYDWTQSAHLKDIEFLDYCFKHTTETIDFVITHHKPFVETLTTGGFEQAYASDLSYLWKSESLWWVFGHTHERNIWHLGSCSFASNAMGYEQDVDTTWNESYISCN